MKIIYTRSLKQFNDPVQDGTHPHLLPFYLLIKEKGFKKKKKKKRLLLPHLDLKA